MQDTKQTIYTGTFTVTNLTGATITNVGAEHWTTDYGPNPFFVGSLAPSATSARTPLQTSSSNTDRWTVSFFNSAGMLLTGQENCGFESEDNDGNVQITLYSAAFNITPPKSSPCDNNSYNQT